MQIRLLKEIVTSLVGSSAQKAVDLLYDKKNVNEFLIAKHLKLTINQTRNILYKLADEGLVSFIRKKDRKKGGWYIYFWTLSSGNSLSKFKEKLTRDLNGLENQLNLRKTKQFYTCPNCNIEYNEENALLNNYVCPECGEVLGLKNPEQDISNLVSQINKIKEIMAEVDKEIESIHEVEHKVRARKQRAEAKKKEKERLERKKEKQKLLKKELRDKLRAKSKKAKSKKNKKNKKSKKNKKRK
jgi:transcription factor E